MSWWSLLLLQAALPSNPPAISAPADPAASAPAPEPDLCPIPPQYAYSDWELTWDERWYKEQWVMQRLHYSRSRTDDCRGTSDRQSKTEGPYRLWQAVPDGRVADVNHQNGPTDDLSGLPLRSSNLPESGAPAPQAPNPDAVPGRAAPAPAHQPKEQLPFYPGIALFIGAVVATWVFRRRKSSADPVPEHVEEPVEGPFVPSNVLHTFDSLPTSGEWLPNPAEVEWIQAFFGIEENGYGPLTREAVARLQRRHNISPDPEVMIGPKTYHALRQEYLYLVHQRWESFAQGFWPADQDRLLDGPMPSDLREELVKLEDAYAAYWEAVEGRYQAIVRRDPLLASGYEQEIDGFQTAGLKLSDIPVLDRKYQPLIDALYDQAAKVMQDANDGDYAKLLAMLKAVDEGKWDEIATVNAAWGGRWDALWRSDKREQADASRVADFLGAYRALSSTPTSVAAAVVMDDSQTSQLLEDRFWQAIGPAPVLINRDGQKRFTHHFAAWADDFNEMVRAHWTGKHTDHAGTPADKLIATYQLTPIKVEELWRVAQRNHVDPRLLLAILVQEGTGSFDTNLDNAGMYLNGNGPQPNWSEDLEAAFDGLILAKLRLYPKAVQGGFTGDWVDYVNWYTPIDRINPNTGKEGESGVYAEDIFWGERVREIYIDVVKALNPDTSGDPVKTFSVWMSSHPELFQPKYVKGDYHIRRGDPSGIEAAVHAQNYDPKKYPNAFHRKDKNGEEVRSWFFFPAPEWYVWTLVPSQSQSAFGAVQYSVPLLKQGADEWKETKMAPEDVEESKPVTIGNYGCAITSAAMALQYLGIETNPNDIVERASGNDQAAARDKRENMKLSMASVWDLNWYHLAQEFPGVKVRDAGYSDLTQLREWLSKGPVILGGTGQNGPHFIVVSGYTGEGKAPSDFLINDPGASRLTLEDFEEDYPTFRWVRQFTN